MFHNRRTSRNFTFHDEPGTNRKVVVITNSSKDLDETNLNDVSNSFDLLKISILNKAVTVSNKYSNITLGPRAKENGHHNSPDSKVDPKKYGSLQNVTPIRDGLIRFSVKKINYENELQRKDKVKQEVEKKKKEMELSEAKKRKQLSERFEKIMIQRKQESAHQLATLEAEEERYAQQLEIERKNKIHKLRVQESIEISKIMHPYRELFYEKFREICCIIKAYQDATLDLQIFTPHVAKLNDLKIQTDAINFKEKVGELCEADIKVIQMLAEEINEVFYLLKYDLDKMEAMQEKELVQRQVELEQAELAAQQSMRMKEAQVVGNSLKDSLEPPNNVQQEILQQTEQVIVTQNEQLTEVDTTAGQESQILNLEVTDSVQDNLIPSETVAENSVSYPDLESYTIYLESILLLENYKMLYQDFIKADNMKKFKFECQKSLNITINAISSGSREQLIDKYEKLRLFLLGKSKPNILLNPQAEAFSKNLLAEKIVGQGDTTISVKPELAFPFAAIAIALWNDWPDFGTLLLAQFRCKSPFFVPVFLVQQSDQSEDDYYRLLGCKYNEDGTPEKPEQFWKRLGGIMYLYSSIIVSKQRQGVNKPHPHGLSNAWRWLAATVNLEPRSDHADICATLIYIILEVTGNSLWKTYPKQFPKMLHVLKNEYYEKLKSFDPVLSAPISRLGDFLTTTLKMNSIPPPKGQLPPNFW